MDIVREKIPCVLLQPTGGISLTPTDYPILLTGWHMAFATFMTQVLARTTTVLDGRKSVKMTGRVFLRAIVPIGATFSGSLMFGNLAYLYLSVPFIQMLKVRDLRNQVSAMG